MQETPKDFVDEYPAEGSYWSHYNGNIYRIVVIANREDTREKYPATVVYVNIDNGNTYARRFSDWHRSMKPWAHSVLGDEQQNGN